MAYNNRDRQKLVKTADFDYVLPDRLIAQTPADKREMSRLMVVRRADGSITHDRFRALGTYLTAGDMLVANRSRVIPARLHARKDTGGEIELFLLRARGGNIWTALARPSRRLRPGMRLAIQGADLTGLLVERLDEGQWIVEFLGQGDVERQLHSAGTVPLPPYIRTLDGHVDRYQTVYADQDGSVAAPTAGLHFSRDLLRSLKASGICVEYVTLHVGLGTFRPVVASTVEEHTMHPEWGDVPAETAARINRTRDAGGKIIAVGTTSTRLLESAYGDRGVEPFQGETDRFIYPGYVFRSIDALVTNFHLPRSTLLMLVSAFAGQDLVLRAYREAVRQEYRFFSFGDAMLIL